MSVLGIIPLFARVILSDYGRVVARPVDGRVTPGDASRMPDIQCRID
jgi:hypothetical protein